MENKNVRVKNLTTKEYAERLSVLRGLFWELAGDLGAVYSTNLDYANKIYNDILHADLVAMSEAPF